mmetsp:Transcript_2881/g.8213  ORF Transcript_2881/g.8213 Transcript_2881/m.8213 type:complete len:326 (-) Transcript_2881:73-1050(-)
MWLTALRQSRPARAAPSGGGVLAIAAPSSAGEAVSAARIARWHLNESTKVPMKEAEGSERIGCASRAEARRPARRRKTRSPPSLATSLVIPESSDAAVKSEKEASRSPRRSRATPRRLSTLTYFGSMASAASQSASASACFSSIARACARLPKKTATSLCLLSGASSMARVYSSHALSYCRPWNLLLPRSLALFACACRSSAAASPPPAASAGGGAAAAAAGVEEGLCLPAQPGERGRGHAALVQRIQKEQQLPHAKGAHLLRGRRLRRGLARPSGEEEASAVRRAPCRLGGDAAEGGRLVGAQEEGEAAVRPQGQPEPAAHSVD